MTALIQLTIAQLQNPALLVQALVMQGLDVSTVPYLFWNNIYTAPLRKAIATNQTPDYATNAAKYDEYIKTKYNDAFLAIRESANKPKAAAAAAAATTESLKIADSSKIQPMSAAAAAAPTTTAAAAPTTTAESMSLAQWLESQYGLAESAVEAVILTLADTHIETYQLLIDSAIDLFSKDSPLGKSSKAYKKQTSAIRKAIASETTRRKVYVDYINTPTTTPTTAAAAAAPTTTAAAAAAAAPTDNSGILAMLAQQMKQQGEMLAALMAQQTVK